MSTDMGKKLVDSLQAFVADEPFVLDTYTLDWEGNLIRKREVNLTLSEYLKRKSARDGRGPGERD